jgi:hypothetical protein
MESIPEETAPLTFLGILICPSKGWVAFYFLPKPEVQVVATPDYATPMLLAAERLKAATLLQGRSSWLV